MPLPVGPLPRSVHLSVWDAKCHYHEANVVLLTEFLLQEGEQLSFSEFQSSLMLGVIGQDGRVGTGLLRRGWKLPDKHSLCLLMILHL